MDFNIYKAFIFDFDYTLCDATEGIVQSYNGAFREFGYPELEKNKIRPTVGLTVPDSFMILTGSEDRELAQKFYKSFCAIADKLMNSNTVFLPGALELLIKLYNLNKPIAVVTTKLSYRITDFFNLKNHPELIDFVIGYDEVKKQKPDPEGIILACEKFKAKYNINKANIAYIGDNQVDARAAEAAEIDFIGVTSGTTTREELAVYNNIAILNGVFELV